MFLGYLLDRNGSIIGEVYSGVVENSVGAFCQSIVLLFMGLLALASAYLHVVDIKNCMTSMPFFWILVICFIILNIFNAQRIIESDDGFFFQSLSVVTSGSIIGGFLFSMAYKSYYLQFHNYKLDLIDGVGRLFGSVFIVSLICIATLILGFIIASIFKFDSNNILSKIVFLAVVIIFGIGSFFSISSARDNAQKNTVDFIQTYSATQMESIKALDIYNDDDYEQINILLKETYEVLENSANKKHSDSNIEMFREYENYMIELRSYLTDNDNYELNEPTHTHFNFYQTSSAIAVDQGDEVAVLSYKPNGKYSRIRGVIETYKTDSINYYGAYFEIFADGIKVYNSGQIKSGQNTEFNVSINNAKKIEIKFHTNIDGWMYDGAMYQITHFYVEE